MMACSIALKRPLEFDSTLEQNQQTSPLPSKRRCSFPTRCSPTYNRGNDEGASTSTSSMWNRYAPSSSVTSSQGLMINAQSPFKDASQKCALSSQQVLQSIYQEYNRMKRRKQLQEPAAETLASMFPTPQEAATTSPDKAGSSSKKEGPLLTFKQAGLLCERLLKEQQEKLCSEYEKALVEKLSEQYEAYVRFSQDHLMRHLKDHSAAYVS